MNKEDPILVINWGPTPEFQKEVECECGQKNYTNDEQINRFIAKYRKNPIFVCVVCAIKKYSDRFTIGQLTSLQNYYGSITN